MPFELCEKIGEILATSPFRKAKVGFHWTHPPTQKKTTSSRGRGKIFMGSLDVHLILWRREFAWRRCSTVDSGASESDSETYAEWQYPTWLQCQDKAPRRPRSWVFSQGVVCSFLFFLRSWLTRISLTFPCTYAGTTTNLLPHPWWFEPHTGWSCLFQFPPVLYSIIKCLLCIIIYYVLYCIIIYYVFYSLVLNSAASTGGIEEMRAFCEHSVALYLTGVTWLEMCLHKPWDVSQQVFTVPMWSFHFD